MRDLGENVRMGMWWSGLWVEAAQTKSEGLDCIYVVKLIPKDPRLRVKSRLNQLTACGWLFWLRDHNNTAQMGHGLMVAVGTHGFVVACPNITSTIEIE
ncbi:hypothetical protein HPP92_006185 [Vanilla planifolia]|uniref:Uncharacterized protein n=1 Tax=Vanilla planifolia TaxID=51239 RepID=A0A835VBN0_VANPL|nr:hypothetical protein HPP92_006185 [Vanilla planifolia]